VSTLELRQELVRKAIHLIAVVFPILYTAGMTRSALVLLLSTATIIALTIELARTSHARTKEQFVRVTGALLREHEQTRLSGATWLILSLLGAVVFLPRDIASAAMWAVAVGDAAAAIVGRAFGRHRWGSHAKSLEGSAACFLVVLGGSVAIAHLPLAESIVSAVAAAAAEWPARPLDDNVRITMLVGVAILLWRIVFS
jgi:dolichol kinase